MSNILQATVGIKGVRPLLWHHFGPDAIPLEKQERTGVAGNDPEEWHRTALVAEDGRLYLDPTYVFATLRDGARYTRRKVGTLQPYVAATLQILDECVFIDRTMPLGPLPRDRSAPVYMDVRMVRNPTTKARNIRYRVAASAGWRASFTILWDKTVVSRGEMEMVVREAGRFAGIGNGRSIGFGRFGVECFDVTEA